MAKNQRPQDLVRKLCRTLAETNQIMATSGTPDKFMNNVRGALEGLIMSRLKGNNIILEQSVQAALISTGSDPIIQMVRDHDGRSIDLSPTQWKGLVAARDPKFIRKLLTKKDGYAGWFVTGKNLSHVLLARAAEDPSGWGALMRDLASLTRKPDHMLLTKKYRSLLRRKPTSQMVEGYLKSQVKEFPTYYAELAKNFAGKDEILPLMLIHLAGVPIKSFISISPMHPPMTTALFARIQSNHGLMSILTACPSITSVLNNGDDFDEWLKTLQS